GGTGSANGTSFASPLTAGVIALLYSVPCASLAAIAHNDPTEAALRVRHALFAGVDQVGNLPGNTVTGGRINAFHSAQFLMDSCEACPAPYNIAASSDAIGSAMLSWSAMPGTYNVRYRMVGAPAWTEVDNLTSTSLPLSGLAACQPYEFQVAANCDTSSSGYGPSLIWTSEGCCTAPLSITVTATDTTNALVAWSTVLASNTYDLRFRTIGAADWTELDGLGGNSAQLTGLTPCSDIEVQMRSSCTGATADWSASATVHVPGCGQCVEGTFCTSSGDASFEWIASVQIAGIDRSSGADGGYAGVETTAQSTSLSIGATYPITLVPGYSGTAFPETFTVWMDLDRNGQFSGSEKVFDPGAAVTAALQDSLTVPATATPGPARMRVVMKYNSVPSSGCTTYDYGETEDYCVNLVNGPTVIGEFGAGTDVRVFPVPADATLTFTTSHSAPLHLVITDATGRTVLVQAMRNGRTTVDTEPLGSGLYHFQLLDGPATVARGNVLVVH
ncbi:MAG: T9SS type A sorting domain-containing protein, partial [Proteobacteria bacterium]|nr:T9SS type A sorting domain-containing protein [Pseudomonadota bacterium]